MRAAAVYLLAPLTWVVIAWIAATLMCLRGRKRGALVVSVAGLALLWVSSMPIVAEAALGALDDPMSVGVGNAPQADAIVVLGGALSPVRTMDGQPAWRLGHAADRVWHAAQLYRAGKAPHVVIAAGGEYESPRPAEAAGIAQLLVAWGVPEQAIVQEGASRTTRENAANAKPVLEQLRARRILLVTSSYHMLRARKTFLRVLPPPVWEVIPSPADRFRGEGRAAVAQLWLPSLEAQLVVTKTIKEFAGLTALAIISDTG